MVASAASLPGQGGAPEQKLRPCPGLWAALTCGLLDPGFQGLRLLLDAP